MIFSSVVNILAIISVIGCSGTDYSQQVKDAEQLLRNGQFAQANEGYLAILQEDPKNIDAATGAAFASLMKGEFKQADIY